MIGRGELAAQPRRYSWATAIATVAVALLATASRYGFHRDERYFMANAENPASGSVDHLPLTPMVGWVSPQLFGNSVFGLGVIPALVGAGIVALTAAISHDVGGDDGRRARDRPISGTRQRPIPGTP